MKLDYNWVSKDVLDHVVSTLVRGGATKKEATSFGDTVVKLTTLYMTIRPLPNPTNILRSTSNIHQWKWCIILITLTQCFTIVALKTHRFLQSTKKPF